MPPQDFREHRERLAFGQGAARLDDASQGPERRVDAACAYFELLRQVPDGFPGDEVLEPVAPEELAPDALPRAFVLAPEFEAVDEAALDGVVDPVHLVGDPDRGG